MWKLFKFVLNVYNSFLNHMYEIHTLFYLLFTITHNANSTDNTLSGYIFLTIDVQFYLPINFFSALFENATSFIVQFWAVELYLKFILLLYLVIYFHISLSIPLLYVKLFFAVSYCTRYLVGITLFVRKIKTS